MVNEHISILNKEIESLIRQVELPPAEAIEWRAAYEEVKENLDKIMDTNDNSIIPEDEIEALSKKKQKLEHKLKDNTNNLKEYTHRINEELNKIKADKYRAVQVMELKISELETSQKELLKEISLFESGME